MSDVLAELTEEAAAGGIALIEQVPPRIQLSADQSLMTQLLLNLLLNWANFQWGPCVFVPFFFNTSALVYMALEVGVCCLEAWAYRRGLPSRGTCTWTHSHPMAYAWAANLASFLAGLCLARVIPGIF